MRTIWKFPLEICSTVQELEMPMLSRIISVHEQVGDICLWALVQDGNPREKRHFVVRGTGHEIETGEHVGTAYVGPFVWHVFEMRP